MAKNNEKGIALIMTLLVMMLMTALLVGFTAVVTSDQRYRYIDRDRNRAFYGASAGIEKMTNDLGTLFLANVAPTESQLTTLAGATPTLDLIEFSAPTTPGTLPTSSLTGCGKPPFETNTVRRLGGNGYSLSYCAQPSGQPTFTSEPSAIISGPYEGLVAQQMPYQLDVTAKTASGGEVHLVRAMEAVAIPVFQFGIFSDVDQSFFAGPNFDFGGRVHTNGNLFLSQGNGTTLTLREKVTAVGEVIRQRMQNNVSIDTPGAHDGTVKMAQAPGVFRNLLRTEGSMIDGLSGLVDDQNPIWHSTSIGTYNSYIRNGRTGARALNLSVIMFSGANIDLIQRPVPAEDTTNAARYGERMYTKASLRILLSDTDADITGLPGASAGAPWSLESNWRAGAPTGYGTGGAGVDATHPPIARSGAQYSGTVSASVTTGTLKSISLTGFGTTGSVANPFTPTISVSNVAGTVTRTATCTGITGTTLTNCTGASGATFASGSPMTITTPAQLDGTPGKSYSINLTASWTSSSTPSTITVSSTTSFPTVDVTINGIPVACNGPSTNAQLRGCTVSSALFPSGIASGALLNTGVAANANIATLGGRIKIERGNVDGTYTDVTAEILNHGIAGPSLSAVAGGTLTGVCGNANAIITLQRARDYASAPCMNSASDYWPNALFDTREALYRDTAPANLVIGGVMYYIGVDASNLSRWFLRAGAYAGGTGNLAKTENGGYTLYFSDRRNNRDASSAETGELGFEDFVNPTTGGTPDNTLNVGEDLNANGTLEVYGFRPSYNGGYNTVPPGAAAPLDSTARLNTSLLAAPRGPLQAQVNRSIFFRHALKLFNGANLRALGITGLTIVSENPVYVQGNWNANGGWTNPDTATAVIADTVTLLSNNWTDNNSFANPYTYTNRNRGSQTWYRLAIISGKGPAFPQPSGTATDFGTDGGAHNFLRYLENGDQAVNYQGSMATFYYNRQAVGTFKCCSTVYSAPTRNYSFDTNFLTPSLLPPNTPMFRDLNAVGFAQDLRPGK